MGIRQYKPTSAGRRGGSVSDFSECTEPLVNAPEKSLLTPHKKKGGRNNQGIVTVRFRGGGHKRMDRKVDFKRTKKDGIPAKVVSIEFTSPTEANVNYKLHAAGQVLNSSGTAVLEDGVWKVSDVTFCTLVVLGNGSRPVKGCA